jgi:hypothetical protein
MNKQVDFIVKRKNVIMHPSLTEEEFDALPDNVLIKQFVKEHLSQTNKCDNYVAEAMVWWQFQKYAKLNEVKVKITRKIFISAILRLLDNTEIVKKCGARAIIKTCWKGSNVHK